MLEYLFFNVIFAKKFTHLLQQKQLTFTEVVEANEGTIVISTPEDIDDNLWDEIDDAYDDLSDQDQLLLQSKLEGDDSMNVAGIYIQLKNQQQTIARIDPNVMNRMLENISMDEFNNFIEAIVTSVETPDDTPFCQQQA